MTALRAAHSFVLVGELGGTLDFKSRLCAQPVPLRKTGVSMSNTEACRKWRAKNRERERERHRQFRADNPDWWRKYQDLDKLRARWAVKNAKRSGTLIEQPCHCGAKAQAHHPDYDRPLDVIWLCSIHHGEAHHAPTG